MSITPIDLNLPSKFPVWRSRQLETSLKIASSDKYAFLLDAPTGSGKSLIGAAVQRLKNQNVLYLCTTKQLQDQLVSDFPYAKVLKGRSNYMCLKYRSMYPEITAEMCTKKEKSECQFDDRCPYQIAKRAAMNAPIAILNTAYFMTEANFSGSFSGANFGILDEFDTVEDQLMSFVEVSFSSRQLEYLHLDPPKFKTKFESWVDWAKVALVALDKENELLQLKMSDLWYTTDPADMKRSVQLGRIISKLTFFVNNVDQNWVWYPGEDTWSFKPVWISTYANNTLWKHIKKVLGMSATILDPNQVMRNIGLKDAEYLALPSTFPKENRPIYYEPCGNIIEKEINIALPQLTNKINAIMRIHPNNKILGHTVSYRIRDYLMTHLDNKSRLITHNVKDKADKLEYFKQSKDPLVMLSPSMDRGVDLPNIYGCNVIIIMKCPYPSLGDPQISKRLYASKDGPIWYAYHTITTIVQMAGRTTRSETDKSTTYILDQQFERLYSQHKTMFPRWFRDAIIS